MSRHARRYWNRDPTKCAGRWCFRGRQTHLACAIGIAACRSKHGGAVLADGLAGFGVADSAGRPERASGSAQRVNCSGFFDHRRSVIGAVGRRVAHDLFRVLAGHHWLLTMVMAQAEPEHRLEKIHDRVGADSIVNHLANNSRCINLGSVDMHREWSLFQHQSGAHWEEAHCRVHD